MKTTKFLSAIAAIGIAIAFYACKGDTGATGPEGPTGAAGQNGVSGLTVTNLTVTTINWGVVSADTWNYQTSVIIPATDLCIVYASPTNSTTNLFPLPISNFLATGDELLYKYGTGQDIYLFYTNPANQAPTSTLYFNIVDIPPHSPIIHNHPNTNWNNAAEVAQLPEVQAALNSRQ